MIDVAFILLIVLGIFSAAIVLTVIQSWWQWKQGYRRIPIGPKKNLLVAVTPKASAEKQYIEARIQYMKAILEGKGGEWTTLTKSEAKAELAFLENKTPGNLRNPGF